MTASCIRSMLLGGLFILLVSFNAPVFSMPILPSSPLTSRPNQAGDTHESGAIPLPRGCGGVTPPGEVETTCCLNGIVYVDGEPVAGAEVTITSSRGSSVSLYTRYINTVDNVPFYEISLSDDQLQVQSGETITITARLGNREHSLTYEVQPGSQQVDIVLPRRHPNDFIALQSVPLRSISGEFDGLSGIAINPEYQVFVVDQEAHQIQAFDTNGNSLQPPWGHYGQNPGQFNLPRRVIVDASRNVYILDAGNRRIQKFDRQGRYVHAWMLCTQLSSCPFPYDLALAPDGTIAVVYNQGVTVFSTTGDLQRQWSTGIHGTDIDIDRNGNVYITTGQSDIYIFTPGGQLTTTLNTPLTSIQSMAIDPSGNLWVTDPINGIVRLSTTGAIAQQWTIPDERFNDMAIAPNGQLYLTSYTNKVLVFDPTRGTTRSWGRSSRYRDVIGTVTVPNNTLFIANREPAAVTRLTFQQPVTSTQVALHPLPRSIVDMTRAADGSVYILDQSSSTTARVYKINALGQQLFSFPINDVSASAIAVAQNGTIFIAEDLDNQVLQFSADGQYRSSWGGTGSEPGRFYLPGDLVIDSNGYIYVADRGNERIQKLRLDGTVEITVSATFDPTLDNVLQVFNNNIYIYREDAIRVRNSDLTSPPSYTIELNNQVKGWDIDQHGNIYAFNPDMRQIEIYRPMRFTQPIATISYLNLSSLSSDDTLMVQGIGQDSDETNTIQAWRWQSSQDGRIGTSRTLAIPAASLSSGTHTITLEVQDNEGEWSQPTSLSVYVSPRIQNIPAWTILLYLDADYAADGQSLLKSFSSTIRNLKQLSNSSIRIAIQIDGPQNNDTHRILIHPGQPPIENSISEQAMDDPLTLANFLRWGQETFPARHYYMAIANHGQGVQGIAWDSTSDARDDGIRNNSAYLTIKELGQALNAPGVAQIDVIHLDACSMGLLEVAFELRPRSEVPLRSRLLIASQYVGWNFFTYDQYVANITATSTPEMVARTVVQIYADKSVQNQVPFTITALDLGRVMTVASTVDRLAAELAAYANNSNEHFNQVQNIRNSSSHLNSDNDYRNTRSDAYVDLLSWTQKVRDSISDQAIQQRANELINELTGEQSFILPNPNGHRVGSATLPTRYGSYRINLNDVHGISIYYPDYTRRKATFNGYVNNYLFEFTRYTRWSELLTAGVVALNPEDPEVDESLAPLAPLSVEYYVHVPMIVR
ncbi:MAG: clostripain-related cysteine peptidase [Chloroflexus sp.]|uniref:clostripain-related cysteine peptidase n=1 Tax=Chloroflexus sp. TaxID=1904827 RepID=UPI00404A632A